MCRLLAVRAREPVGVRDLLVEAAHSLCRQSGCDARGESHRDGWGVGWYAGGRPIVVRGTRAACDDVEFRAAASCTSSLVVAHVRQASIGPASPANTHPFAHGCWLFAHNGTVTDFPRVRGLLESQTLERFLPQRRGETDSETVFYWLLSMLDRAGEPPDQPAREVGAVVDVVARGVRRLAEWCGTAEFDGERGKFNFVLADGENLVASRFGHTLHWAVLDQPAPGGSGRTGRLVIASEPVVDGDWHEVPPGSILGVDGRLAPLWRLA